MIKSEIAKKERFAPIRFAEDFCYIRDCAFYCKKVAVMDEVLYFYRRDNENAMTSHFFSEKYRKHRTVSSSKGEGQGICRSSNRCTADEICCVSSV